jgi:hypothetical protein
MQSYRSPVFSLLALLWSITATAADVVMVSDTVEAQATVVAIDKQQRRILLRDTRGGEYDVIAGPDVRNFDQIRKGDQVEVLYQRAAASRLEKIADPNAAVEFTSVERAEKGAKPGMTATRSRTVAAKVIEIDTRHRLLTVKGPQGNVLTVRVPPTVLAFDELQVGDTIAAGYTEAIAISVRPPVRTK